MHCSLQKHMPADWRKDTRVQIGVYLAAFTICLVCIQKIDDYGSAWRLQDSAYMNCTVTPDGAVRSPVCNAADIRAVSAAWQSPPSSAQIPGFCTPRAPWFWYDLGGTMCVCEKKWERSVYWQKVMTSFAFNFPHFMTPFQIYIVYQRWQWVFMYITFNEVFEETCLAVTGKWGFTFDAPYDLEPRYDSLIRDVLLCGIPGLLFGMAFVRVMKVPRFMLAPLDPHWEHTGRHSIKYHLKILFQMLALKQIALVYNTDSGVSTFYPQNVVLIAMNLALILSFYLHNRSDWGQHCQPNIACFHLMWAFFSMGMWSLTVYPLLDELYLLCVGLACSSLVLLAIFVSTRHSNLAARIMIGVCRDVARMNDLQYETWVDDTQPLQISSLQQRLGVYAAQGRTHISIHALITPDPEPCPLPDLFIGPLPGPIAPTARTPPIPPTVPHEKACEKSILLSESPESPTTSFYEMSLEVEPPASSAVQFEKHHQMVYFGVAFASLALLSFGLSEPYTYAGLMYRRHWCGLVMAHGGNGCLFMD